MPKMTHPDYQFRTCPLCGKTTYHPVDIVERYCGYCHQYSDDQRDGEKVIRYRMSQLNNLTSDELSFVRKVVLAAWHVGRSPVRDYDTADWWIEP